MHSEIYNLGLIMISLITGRDQRMQLPGDENWYAYEEDFDNCYSSMLHSTIADCLFANLSKRISLRSLLIRTKEGLAKWEAVYGTANLNVGSMQPFMKYDTQSKDQFPIGAKAPDHYGWPRKRKIEPVADELIDPALLAPATKPPSPKKARTREDSQSKSVPGELLAALKGSPAAGPAPAESSKTLLGTSPKKGESSKAHGDKKERSVKSESSEERGGFVPRSLRDKQAERKAKKAEDKKPSIIGDEPMTRKLRGDLVKQDLAAKNFEYEAVGGDDDLQTENRKPNVA